MTDSPRDQQVFVMVTAELRDRLDAFAERNHWTRSTAAAILIERGLIADEEQS